MRTAHHYMTPDTAARYARQVFENRLPQSRYDRFGGSTVTAFDAYQLVSEISNRTGSEVADAIEAIMPELFADYWLSESDVHNTALRAKGRRPKQ